MEYLNFKKLLTLSLGILMLMAGVQTASAQTYCTPEYSNTGCNFDNEDISNVTLNGESINLNNSSQCSPNAYTDYTNSTPHPDLATGSTYSITVSSETSGFGAPYLQIRAWIDYNHNGIFESSEEIANSNGQGFGSYMSVPQTFQFTIPTSANTGLTRMRVRVVDGPPTNNFSPCDSFNYGEAEDYLVSIFTSVSCSNNTIDAGRLADTTFVCSADSFALIDTNVTILLNMAGQWQSSPAGSNNWSDISGATAPTSPLRNGITSATDFRYIVYCTNNTTIRDTSTVMTAVINPPTECYCIPVGAQDNFDQIVNFHLANLDNSSNGFHLSQANNGYQDFTDSVGPATLYATFNYIATMTAGSGTSQHGAAIWIDYDDDGIFETSERVATIGNNILPNQTVSFPGFTPSLSDTGLHRLRVQYVEGHGGITLDPCVVANQYGETEDYMVNVLPLPNCTGRPNAGSVTPSLQVCAGNSFDIETVGATFVASGLEGQWQAKPSGTSNWTDINGATDTIYTVSNGITTATNYRYILKCINSGLSDTTNIISVTLNAPFDCYCVPTPAPRDTLHYIKSFFTIGALADINNLSSGPSPGGYGDFTDVDTIKVRQGSSFDFTAEFGRGNTASAKVWVDWNQNINFNDPGELVFQSTTSYSTFVTNTIGIPSSAALGLTRLRIRINSITSQGPSGPCVETAYPLRAGETEDYALLVLPPIVSCDSATFSFAIRATTDKDSFCHPTNIMLDLDTNLNLITGVSYQWQSASSASGPWQDIGMPQNTPSKTVNNVTSTTWYRCHILCDSNSSVVATSENVAVYSKAPHIIGVDVSNNGGGSFSFEAVGADTSDNFVWHFGDGESSHEATPNHTYAIKGNYHVLVIVSNDCGSDTAFVDVNFLDNGILHVGNNNKKVEIYPNPAFDKVTIENASPFKMKAVTVYNILGQKIFHGKAGSKSYKLFVGDYAAGVYQLKVIFKNNSIIFRKFVISN